MIKWISKADTKKLQLFLYALSGSNALGTDSVIKINRKQPERGVSIVFHTCYNSFDLDYENIQTEEDLIKDRLEVALEIIQSNTGFDFG